VYFIQKQDNLHAIEWMLHYVSSFGILLNESWV